VVGAEGASATLNNDIRITKHEEFWLFYDLPIGIERLRWKELVEWWAVRSPSDDPERSLYKRLRESFESRAEKKFFRLYFQILRNPLQERLPAIVPRVYCITTPTPSATSRAPLLSNQRRPNLSHTSHCTDRICSLLWICSTLYQNGRVNAYASR
jgi:hypothetical protein